MCLFGFSFIDQTPVVNVALCQMLERVPTTQHNTRPPLSHTVTGSPSSTHYAGIQERHTHQHTEGHSRGKGGFLRGVISELVKRVTVKVNGGWDSLKYWDAGLLRLGEKSRLPEKEGCQVDRQ